MYTIIGYYYSIMGIYRNLYTDLYKYSTGSVKVNRKIVSLAAASVALISLCGCGKNASEAEGKLITSQMTQSDVYDIKLDYQGIVRSKESKNYSFLSGGRLQEVYVKEGDFVHAGDTLAQLDAVELMNGAAQSRNNKAISQNNLNKTEATYLTNITNAEINIRTLRTGISAIDSNIGAYRQTLSAAEQGVRDYERSIPIAQQGLEALQKTVDTDDAQIAATKENLEAYEKKLESTREAVDLAKTNLERMQTLYDKGAVSKSEVESTQVKYNDAEASYAQAAAQKSNYEVNLSQLEAAHIGNLANLDSKKLEIDSMNTQLASNRAQVSSMRAQLESLNSQRAQSAAQLETANKELANLRKSMESDVSSQTAAANISALASEQADRAVSNATLKADADGYVMKVNVKKGEMTGAGTPVVIVKSDTKVVSVGVSTSDYSDLQSILEIRINNDTEGKIDTIAQYPDEKTQTYTVDISFDNNALTMGQIVDVELVTEHNTGVFIPISSVINIDGIDYVYKVNEDNTVSRVEVELGEVRNTTVRAKNLHNERIVTSGIKSLNDNDRVKEKEDGDAK